MALPKYTKKVAIPTGSGVESKDYIGSVFTVETVQSSAKGYLNATSGQLDTYSGTYNTAPNAELTITARWHPPTTQCDVNSGPECYLGSKQFCYTNFFNRNKLDALLAWIDDKIQSGTTGTLEFSTDPTLSSTDLAMVNFDNNSSFMSSNWVYASAYVAVGNSGIDPTYGYRFCNISIDFDIRLGTWNGSYWTSSGNYHIMQFDSGTNAFYTKVLEAINKAYSECGKMFVTLSPYFSTSFYMVSGKSRMRFSAISNGRALTILYKNPKEMGELDQTHIYFRIQTLNTGNVWTIDGTIDPTDPGETPTPNPPPPPTPDPDPVPPIDPDPINPSDPIPPPGLPDLMGCNNGFFTAWSPSLVTLRLIADKLWSPNIVQQLINAVINPINTILALGIIPVRPTTVTSDSYTVHFGWIDSDVKAPMVTSDYVQVDCGSVYLQPYYNNYLDYEPYTKMSLYIPYIGEFDLNPDEVTGKTIRIFCNVNVITGDMAAVVTANGNVVYTAAGNCFRSLPVTAGDATQIIQAGVAAAGIIAGAAVGGAAAGLSGAAATNAGAVAAGGTAMTGAEFAGAAVVGATEAVGGSAGQAIGGLAGQVMGSKMHYHRAGQMGTGSGQLANRKPFITILRPNLMLPDGAGDTGTNSDLKAYKGYPSNQIMQLTSATGMTVVEDCRLAIPGATADEVAEALSIMKGGYIA